MSGTRIVRGRWIVTGGAEADPVIDDGAVVVAGTEILEVGAWDELRARHHDVPVLGSARTAVLPGMVNAHHHSHGVSTLQQGIEDRLLESWLLTLNRSRATDLRLDTLLSAARLLRCGVTSVVDVHSAGGTAEAYAAGLERALGAYEEAGIRVAFAPGARTRCFLVAGGPGADDAFLAELSSAVRDQAKRLLPAAGDMTEAEYFDIMDDVARRYRDHPRIDLWFGPPGPQWVSDAALQKMAERAEAMDMGIQTHVTESLYEKLHGPRCTGKATVAHLRDLGVLGPRFSIAHGVWLTEPEIAIMAETGAAVSHNPSSNLRLRAGIAPLNVLLDGGVTVALGMDGTALNDDEDMFTEMRLALRLNRTPRLGAPVPTPARVFEMATAGGAKLLRKAGRLGRIAAGCAADLVLLDLDRITWPWAAPECDARELILLRAGAGDVDCVLIDGEVVLQGGQPTRFDLEAAGRELAAILAAQAYPREAADLVEALRPHVEGHYRAWDLPALEPYTAYNSKN